MWLLGVAASLLAATQGSFGQDIASECPAPTGYFADARQCDKYYKCVDNVLTEKLCPDGMAFNDINPHVEKCDLLAVVDCSGRTQLQTPKPTENCERQNGNFPVVGSNDCSQAYRCQDGVGTLITCPVGLSFALDTGICDWPDQSGRKGCLTEETQNFTCPRVKQQEAVAHPRYADPHDCQYFYVCINGKTPRRNGCKFGQVFNTNTTACGLPQEVPECADYYTEFFDEHFALVEQNPSALSEDVLAAAILAGYPVPLMADRVRITPGGAKGSPLEPREPAEPAEPTPRPGRTRLSPQRPSSQSSPQADDSKPGDRPLRRRRPGTRRRKTTTTTTTTTAAPEYYDDDYYYYEDEAYVDDPAAGKAADTTGSEVEASPASSDPAPPASRSSSSRFRPSA
ncbi:protein obstructor-E-like [Eriocheir sinensis]|uniref:protein obstructor-E-like n=1 Tax=Eriocheir sinensis TaxID=95602 RepID=UPI0021CA2FE0|nr:protein obstructor-E-like [Eriocheir sinensis]